MILGSSQVTCRVVVAKHKIPKEAVESVTKDKDINMLANPNAKHGKYVKLSKAPISISN